MKKKTNYYMQNENIKQDPRKHIDKALIEDQLKKSPKLTYYSTKDSKNQSYDKKAKKYPIPDKKQKFSSKERENYFFKQKSHCSKQNQNLYTKQQQKQFSQWERQIQFEEAKYDSSFSIQDSYQLINLIQKIPDFKFNLTIQEKQVVGTKGNIIVIGRSGTGKTTCALVRLFAIQVLFKEKKFKNMIKKRLTQQRYFRAQNIDQIFGLKNVFLTASPLLIAQIKKQYLSMLRQIKFKLKKHNQSRHRQEQKQQTLKEKIMMQNVQNININVQNEKESKRVKSFSTLQEKQYPGFFSIKTFILMIDETLQRPFFIESNQKMKPEDNIGWKSQQSQFQILNRWPLRIGVNQNVVKLQQVNYEDFRIFFDEVVPNNFKNCTQNKLKAITVWSQIYSVIKGSYYSHTYHCKYLSEGHYLAQSQNKFYSDNDKRKIYRIFDYYESWKKLQNKYDFMDIVNNVLFQIKQQGYKGPMLNYLFIDEVQDLTPATIYLLSLIVTNGLFYCGDTAQAITKGVSFRFSDIKSIFFLEQFKRFNPVLEVYPTINQLTTNFRSHNQILRLANGIVSLIQLFFPKSIDKLISETSQMTGPQPFIIEEKDDFFIFRLLCDPQKIREFQQKFSYQSMQKLHQKQKPLLNSQQIVIIRNKKQKQKLPFYLKNCIVLTIQQAKGLQFQDVILYKFFQTCPCPNKWKLIKYYDSKYSQKRKQIQISSYFQLLTELKMFYTIITRAKLTFTIFDNKIPEYLKHFFINQKLVNQVSQLLQGNSSQKLVQMNKKILQYRKTYNQTKKKFDQKKQWLLQGDLFFERKIYDQAIKCYEMAEEFQKARLTQAQKWAEQAALELKKYKMTNKMVIDNEFSQQKMNKPQKYAFQKFQKAGKIFLNAKQYQKAGNCFFSGKHYNKAQQCFQKINMRQGLALCKFMQKKYIEAAIQYKKLNNHPKVLECYEIGKQWKQALQYALHNFFIIQNYNKKIKKYAKLMLKESISQLKKVTIKKKFKFQNIYKANKSIQKIQKLIMLAFINQYKPKVDKIIEQFQHFSLIIVEIKTIDEQIPKIKQQIKILRQNDIINLQYDPQQYLKNQQQRRNYIKGVIKKFKDKYLYQNKCFYGQYAQKQVKKNCKQLISKMIKPLQQYQQLMKIKFPKKSQQIYYQKQNNKNIQQSQNNQQQSINNLLKQEQAQRNSSQQQDTEQDIYEDQSGKQSQKDYNQIYEGDNYFEQQQNIQDEKRQIDQKEMSCKSESSYTQQKYSVVQQIADAQIFDVQNYVFQGKIIEALNENIIQQWRKIVSPMSDLLKQDAYLQTDKLQKYQYHHFNKIYLADINFLQIKKQGNRERQRSLQLLKNIQKIGENYICSLLSQYFQCSDHALKFILSHCLEFSHIFWTSTTYFKNKKIKDDYKILSLKDQIEDFLNQIRKQWLEKQLYGNFFNQPIINYICDGLMLQGSYEFVLNCLNNQQSNQLLFLFMNHTQLCYRAKKQFLHEKCKQYKFIEIKYLFLQNKSASSLITMINTSSLQQIYFIFDFYHKKSLLSKISENKQPIKFMNKKKELMKIIDSTKFSSYSNTFTFISHFFSEWKQQNKIYPYVRSIYRNFIQSSYPLENIQICQVMVLFLSLITFQDLAYKFKKQLNIKDSYCKGKAKIIRQLFKILACINKKINQFDNQYDFQFVQCLLGFFQCRIIKNCPTLRIIEKQYVVVRQTSAILDHIGQKTFAYYFDNNQQIILMKLEQVYCIVTKIVNKRYRQLDNIFHFQKPPKPKVVKRKKDSQQSLDEQSQSESQINELEEENEFQIYDMEEEEIQTIDMEKEEEEQIQTIEIDEQESKKKKRKQKILEERRLKQKERRQYKRQMTLLNRFPKDRQKNSAFQQYQRTTFEGANTSNWLRFINNQTEKQISEMRTDLLQFYFKNKHNQAEVFHLVYHQLKELYALKIICEQSQYFSNTIIQFLKLRLNQLNKIFHQWKMIHAKDYS